MSKHHKTAGVAYETLNVGDQIYKLRPLKVGVYAEMEAYVLSQRIDPLQAASEAISKIPPQYHQAIWDAAMKAVMASRTVSAQEMAAFGNSPRGIAWMLWKLMEQDHPEINSVETAIELMERIGPERAQEIQRKIQIASGESDAEKSFGQAEETKDTAPAGP